MTAQWLPWWSKVGWLCRVRSAGSFCSIHSKQCLGARWAKPSHWMKARKHPKAPPVMGVASLPSRSKHTINIDKSIEFGHLIPHISVEDIGISTIIGKRSYQEDRCKVAMLNDDVLYMGIFDGHGGSLASSFAASNMDSCIARLMKKESDMAAVLYKAFLEVNNSLQQYIRKNRPEKERYSGTTATVCLLVDNVNLYTASVGDSRAILCRQGRAISLTRDQNPEREDERKRVEKAGGTIFSNSLGVLQVNGRLSMTRSIGDFDLKNCGVSAEPEHDYRKLKHTQDSCIVLVTDGVTFSMTNEEIMMLVSSCKTAQEAADLITENALVLRSDDNSSTIILPLGSWGNVTPQYTDIRNLFGRSLSLRD